MQRAWYIGLGLLFVGSGACGVGLELLWTRMLMGVFGGTTLAVVTVLTAYMGGLAWGSWWGGRLVDRLGTGREIAWRAALLYGLCEIGVGLWALWLPWWISGLPSLQRAVAEGWGSGGLTAGRFVICVLLLGIPTTLMGATLPLLSRAFLRDTRWLGAEVGRLYALNTAGAVLGAFGLGFFLLPWWGMWRSLCLLAGIDILIGLLACVVAVWIRSQRSAEQGAWLDVLETSQENNTPLPSNETTHNTNLDDSARSEADEHSDISAQFATNDSLVLSAASAVDDIEKEQERQRLRKTRWLVGLGLACSGGLGMIAQVAWTRAFSMVLGSSTYAFSMILVVFLTGLAIGGGIGGWLARRSRRLWWVLGSVFLIAGLGTYATLLWMDALPLVFFRWTRGLALSPWILLGIKAVLCGGMIFVPTLAMGMSFPLALQAWWQTGQRLRETSKASEKAHPLGAEVGRLYALNTIGAILGSASVGFVWIPWLGMQGALWCVVLGYGLWAIVFWSEGTEDRVVWRAIGMTGGLVVLGVVWLWTPAWSPHRMSLGLFRVAHLQRMTEAALRQPAPVLFYREGLHTTVTVERFGPHIGLKVNGKTDASTAEDMPTQILSGALPMVLHPDAQDVAVIGWGSGVTVGSVLQFPVKRVIAVELEPAVVEGAKAFAPWNHQPERDPRLQIRFDDGRNFLAVSKDRFDVLISEPSNPWMSGVSALFTVEFFQMARARLRKGGILCQWIQLYELSPDNIRALLHSVVRVFPHVHLFALSRRSRDTLLIATLEPLQIQREQIAQHFAEKRSRAELVRGGMQSPIDLLPRLLADDEALRILTRGAALNTDDNARLEMRAPFELLTHVETDGAKVLLDDLGVRAHRWHRLFPLPVMEKEAPPLLRAAFEAELALAWLRFGDPQRAKNSLSTAQNKLRDALSQKPPHRHALPLESPQKHVLPKSKIADDIRRTSQVLSLLTQASAAAKISACLPTLHGEQFQPAPLHCPTLLPQLPTTARERADVLALSRRHPRRIMTRGLLLYHKGRKQAALREMAHLIQHPTFLHKNRGLYFLLGQLYQAAQIEPEAVWFTRLFVETAP